MATLRMKKKDRINQIKHVTLSLIKEKPLGDIRTLEISQNVGISEAGLFKYFNSKEEIFESIIQQYIEYRHPHIDPSEIDSPVKFKNFLNEYVDSMMNIKGYRIAYLRLLLQISMNKHPLAKKKYDQLVTGLWSVMENRIEYGKKHWGFTSVFNTPIQVRLFHLSILMFLIEQEVFEAKAEDPHCLKEVKKTAINNLFKLLQGENHG